MELTDYLHRNSEALPDWIQCVGASGHGSATELLEDLLRSRTVYYPGSGIDGSPVSLFNRARAAHCFIYCDNGLSLPKLERELKSSPFAGYEMLVKTALSEKDFECAGCPPPKKASFSVSELAVPHASIIVFKRKSGFTEHHGSMFFAILFLGWDGFNAFDSLFCKRIRSKPPYCVVLQDHGFGGATESFGKNGLLERMVKSSNKFPEHILVANNTAPWTGYLEPYAANTSTERLTGWPGGMHGHSRRLFVKSA